MLLAAVSRSSAVGTAIRYVLPLLSMTSRLTINRPNKDDARKASILEVSHRHRATLQEFYTVVHTQTGSPWSTTRPGAKSDVYDSLVVTAEWPRKCKTPTCTSDNASSDGSTLGPGGRAHPPKSWLKR